MKKVASGKPGLILNTKSLYFGSTLGIESFLSITNHELDEDWPCRTNQPAYTGVLSRQTTNARLINESANKMSILFRIIKSESALSLL
jgi:hypothetical protein